MEVVGDRSRTRALRVGATLTGIALVTAGAAVSRAHTPADIVQVELAGSPNALQHRVVGDRTDADAVANIQRYLDSLPYDRYLFIPAYVVGLGLVLWVGKAVLPRRWLRGLSHLLVYGTVLAGLLDLLEDHGLGVALGQLIEHPQGTTGVSAAWLSVARVAAAVKFALLVPAVIVGVGAALDGLVRRGRPLGSGSVLSPDA
ncbi:MAG: hypothetical protein M3P23_06045 [Actinomycetota bacterium]|nr:hypothetical protein [Actinomycetota bacterium]